MKEFKMMDPLLTISPSLTPIPNSVVVNGTSCKHSSTNGHPPTTISEDPFKQDSSLISLEDVKDLLEFFVRTTYKARDTQPKVQYIMKRCMQLFGIDYNYSILSNSAGELSTNYPSNLIILESEKDLQSPAQTPKSSPNGQPIGGLFPSCSYSASNAKIGLYSSWKLNSTGLTQENVELPKLKELCSRARLARCRARFPIPVILYNQKHICRSATLSGGPEIYGRSSFDYFFSGGGMDAADPGVDDEDLISEAQSDWQLFDRVRSQDIRLLKTFQVQTIVDLMVEKKKVKFGMNVTSSEKVDKENRYAEFNIVSLPYPGCEFFKQYRDNGYNAEELVFEWNQGVHDATICVPSDPTSASLSLDWSQYKDWDLVVLSQNYLKLLLGYLRDRDNGLLIHCISGWDRTPLFVSLLRLSLWADGAIHKSLDADQILYLTLAYDWLLFGHNLEDRLSKGEEIMFFCFNFLKYIVSSEFSINEKPEILKSSQLSRVRNDSDIHLEGVLLDMEGYGVCHTSPEGSNWSLNSCGSSPSTKSQETPPAYFQVAQDSWEDCNSSQTHRNGSIHSLVHNSSQPKLTTNGSLTTSCIITASMINSTTVTPTSSITTGGFSKSQSPNRIPPMMTSTVISSVSKPVGFLLQDNSKIESMVDVGSPKSSTSPVAVPPPNRLHLNNHTRHDSNSSASIGSWQFISGSLRENIFPSVPESCSSRSNPYRLSTNLDVECILSSDSSATLVEDLTPVEPNASLLKITTQKLQDDVDNHDIQESLHKFEEEISAAFEDSLKIRNQEIQIPDSLNLMMSSQDDNIATATTTPTKEHEDLDVVDGNIGSASFTTNNNDNSVVNCEASSRRLERLDEVRSKFYSLYEGTIRNCRVVNESTSSSSSLGFLIGNIATKVGIRSSIHRTTHV